MTRMPYSIELTADEYNTLHWLEARGYSGDLIAHATEIEEPTDDEDGAIILRYSESDAWQVQATYDEDPHAFGACAGDDLLGKMHGFLDRIV